MMASAAALLKSLGKGKGVDHGIAADQPRDDACERLTGLEGILASLQKMGIAAQ